MITPLRSDITLDEKILHKAMSLEKAKKLMEFDISGSSSSSSSSLSSSSGSGNGDNDNEKLIRCASTGLQSFDKKDVITLFASMLQYLNIHSGSNIEEIMSSISSIASQSPNAESMEKTAASKSKDKSETVKIVSKNIKDSHYEVDVSKDVVNHKGKKVYMVSCYMKDAYLGRYIIKRNYFFTIDREESAEDTYDEILKKVKSLKDRYYNGIVKVPAVTSQMKIILDGVISEMEIKEDSLGTTVNRSPYPDENNRN